MFPHEAKTIFRNANHPHPQGARGRHGGGGRGAPAWCFENTIYRWKARYGGLEIPGLKRLKELGQENARLKRPLYEAELDKASLKEFVEENGDGCAAAPGRRAPDKVSADSNNGPEFMRKAMSFWAARRGVRMHFIQPRTPTVNAFV